MSYVEAVIAIIITIIAVTAIFFAVSAQQQMYSNILENELLQLYSEDLFWSYFYNLPNTTPFEITNTTTFVEKLYIVEGYTKVEKDINCIKFDISNGKSIKIYYFEK